MRRRECETPAGAGEKLRRDLRLGGIGSGGTPVDRIYLAAERAARRYDTRNPYELLKSIGATLRFIDDISPDELKGWATIQRRRKFAVINSRLDEHEQRIVAGHEAAHLILHRNEILRCAGQTMKDFELYNETSRLEYQANQFLADFLVTDEQVMNATYRQELDYFGTASTLDMPPELLAFKLYSMMNRSLPVRPPVDLKSDFMKY